MTKKNKVFIIIFLIINICYLIFILGEKKFNTSNNELPTITFDQELITVSVKDGEDVLLKGVKGYDNEDGDITKNIFIYNISTFDDQNQRTITYGIFDNDDQMITASRKLKYTDYKPPKFTSSKALINLELYGSDSSFVGANSSVDGDISNKVSMNSIERDGKTYYQYNVTDSAGITSTIEVVDNIDYMSVLTNTIDINLKKYIIYVKQGTELEPAKYIDSVETSLGIQESLKSLVQYETNYNSMIKGQYEVEYTINRTNGQSGKTRLIVIVE